MSATSSPIDRLGELGGELFLSGDMIGYRIPDSQEARALLAEIQKDREAVIAMLQDHQSKAPSLEEVEGALPAGVHLLSYEPKRAPFEVAPTSVVTSAGTFFSAYLQDLKTQLEKPEGYHSPRLADIVSKLADAGLELEIEGQA